MMCIIAFIYAWPDIKMLQVSKANNKNYKTFDSIKAIKPAANFYSKLDA